MAPSFAQWALDRELMEDLEDDDKVPDSGDAGCFDPPPALTESERAAFMMRDLRMRMRMRARPFVPSEESSRWRAGSLMRKRQLWECASAPRRSAP